MNTTMTFTDALKQVTELARHKLPPTLHERLERALTLVQDGAVWLEEDGQSAFVRGSHGEWRYSNGHCACPDAVHRDGLICKHRLAVGLVRRAHELMHKPVVLPEDEPTPAGIDPRFITHLHGKQYIQYVGLLALA